MFNNNTCIEKVYEMPSKILFSLTILTIVFKLLKDPWKILVNIMFIFIINIFRLKDEHDLCNFRFTD